MGTTDELDGRRLRREQNREAVLDALVELFREGLYEPSANEIAERAGLSPRSLFRYFDDVDDLHRAAVERQLRRARHLVALDVTAADALDERVARLVRSRSRLWEELAPGARAVRVCGHRHPTLAKELAGNRAFLRRQLRDLFEPELRGDSGALLATLDVLCSFESYDLLRFDQGLSRPKAVAALVTALMTLLHPGGPR